MRCLVPNAPLKLTAAGSAARAAEVDMSYAPPQLTGSPLTSAKTQDARIDERVARMEDC